jgi:predicted nucleic acid-binding protein
MIVLDTNVVSEAMKIDPHPAVPNWLNEQSAETLFLSSVTLAEQLFGVSALPGGKRQDLSLKALDSLMALFGDRVLPFDTSAARRYAKLAVKARGAAFQHQTATSPRSPLRVASSSHHRTRLPSRQPASPSLILGSCDPGGPALITAPACDALLNRSFGERVVHPGFLACIVDCMGRPGGERIYH